MSGLPHLERPSSPDTWDQMLAPQIVWEISQTVKQNNLRDRLDRQYHLRRQELQFHPVLNNTRTGMDSGVSSDEEYDTHDWSTSLIDNEEEDHRHNTVYYNIRGRNLFSQNDGSFYGILPNPRLPNSVRRQFLPHALGSVTLDSRVLSAYPVAYHILSSPCRDHVRRFSDDMYAVFWIHKGTLQKSMYSALDHARHVHGPHLLLMGQCHGPIRGLLTNHKGTVIDIQTSYTTRV